ncbi:MAG: gamma-glutamyltransferase [Hyphomicrobiaceae bacterium]
MIRGRPVYTHSPVEAEYGVVAGGHPLAAEAGVRIMQEGGNAIDALVAAAFTSFVVEPASCGIGGYGHISIWLQREQRHVTIDAYCRAPLKSRPDMFEVEASAAPTYYGHPFTKGNKAMDGVLAPAVPGAIKGFGEAHRRFGRLPFGHVLQPAIEAADAGVPFSFADKLTIAQRAPGIGLPKDSEAVLLPDGRPPRKGIDDGVEPKLDTLALARTLRRLATEGPESFYRGPVAEAFGKYMRSIGAILDDEDLAAYKTRPLIETPSTYRGIAYTSCFDQVVYEALNILEMFDLATAGPDSFTYRHLVAEALAVAFTDSMRHYGDPDFVPSPINGLTSKAFAQVRAALLRPSDALLRPVEAGDPWPYNGNDPVARPLTDSVGLARRDGTSQVATADREGNMTSTCMSLGSGFGSMVFVPEFGCFLNNAMQNYDPRPGLPNSIASGKMPIFAAPALVAARDGEALFAGSGSGGYRIETGVLHTFLNLVEHGMALQQAVDQPRVHCQGGPTSVDHRIGLDIREALAAAGHEVVVEQEEPGGWAFGRVSAVAYDAKRKCLTAGAGPSWQTGVAGY